MVYQHTCVHERETQKEKSEKWGSGKCMVFAQSLLASRRGDLSGSQVRDVSCTFPFPLRRPLQQSLQTRRTMSSFSYAATRTAFPDFFLFFFHYEAGCRLSSALCTQDTGTISTFECEPVRSACAVATRARRCRLLATREAAAESARAAACQAACLESSLQGERR